MNQRLGTLATRAGLLIALCAGTPFALADEAPITPPPTESPDPTPILTDVPKLTTDPVVEETTPTTVEPGPVDTLLGSENPPLEDGGLPGVVMPSPGEGGFPIAYSMGHGGSDPLPYERTMTTTSEAPDATVSALPSVSLDAVAAVSTIESEATVSAMGDGAAALDTTQLTGDNGETIATGVPSIRDGHLAVQ